MEEATPENKPTVDNLTEGSSYWRLILTSFMKWTLLWYQYHRNKSKWWKADWYPLGTFLKIWKSKTLRQKLSYISVKWKSVMSDSLWHHGLFSPWNSPGQNPGLANCFLLQGLIPPRSPANNLFAGRLFTSWATRDNKYAYLSCLPISSTFSAPATPETAKPTPSLPPLWSIQGKNNEDENFYELLSTST